MKKFKYRLETFSICLGAGIVIFGNFYVSSILPFIVPILNVIGGLICVIPPAFLLYTKYRIRKESERSFLSFIMDLRDSINSGMTLPLALQQCSRRDYPSLTKYIKKLAAQVDWGIPFDKAFHNFAEKTYSPVIKRAVMTITESYKAGGRISDMLDSVTKSIITVNKINEERKSMMYSQIVIIYIIFFIFIAILIVIEVMIIPSLPQTSLPGFFSSVGMQIPVERIKEILIYLIIIQGIFSGLVAGKMSEDSIVSGLKHSLFLSITGYLLFSLTTQIQISLI